MCSVLLLTAVVIISEFIEVPFIALGLNKSWASSQLCDLGQVHAHS